MDPSETPKTHDDSLPSSPLSLSLSIAERSGHLEIAEYLRSKIQDASAEVKRAKKVVVTQFGEEDDDVVARRNQFLKQNEPDFNGEDTKSGNFRFGVTTDPKEILIQECFHSFFAESHAYFTKSLENATSDVEKSVTIRDFLEMEKILFASLSPLQSQSRPPAPLSPSMTSEDVWNESYCLMEESDCPLPETVEDVFEVFSILMEEANSEEMSAFLSSLDMSKVSRARNLSGCTLLHFVCSAGRADVALQMAQQGCF